MVQHTDVQWDVEQIFFHNLPLSAFFLIKKKKNYQFLLACKRVAGVFVKLNLNRKFLKCNGQLP